MQELIERLEKATGPDRELDLAIWQACKPEDGWSSLLPHHVWWDSLACRAAPFTASIDAALTLVPKDWQIDGWFIGTDRSSCLDMLDMSIVNRARIHVGHDYSPAIALCITALKARSALLAKSRTSGAENGN